LRFLCRLCVLKFSVWKKKKTYIKELKNVCGRRSILSNSPNHFYLIIISMQYMFKPLFSLLTSVFSFSELLTKIVKLTKAPTILIFFIKLTSNPSHFWSFEDSSKEVSAHIFFFYFTFSYHHFFLLLLMHRFRMDFKIRTYIFFRILKCKLHASLLGDVFIFLRFPLCLKLPNNW